MDNVSNVALATARAASQQAYQSGYVDGVAEANRLWEARAAEQEAITKSVRQHIVDLEIQVQSLTQELVEVMYALDAVGARRVRLFPPTATGLSGEPGSGGEEPVDTAPTGEDDGAGWLPRAIIDTAPGATGAGEHIDGELIHD